MIKQSLSFSGSVIPQIVYLMYWKIVCKVGEFWEVCGRENRVSLYSFWQGFNEKIQLWLLRFLWYDIWHMFLLCLIRSLLCSLFHFIIISRWKILSEKGRIQFTALPWEVFIFYVFFSLIRIQLFPLSTSQRSFTPYNSNLIVKLHAYLASVDNLHFSFNLCSCCLCPTQPRKPRKNQNQTSFISLY